MRALLTSTVLSLMCLYGFTQNLKWSTFIDTSTTFSSPRGVDLTNDGILDVVIGGGLDGFSQSNGVNAINGADGSILWNFATNEEMFGSAKFMDINNDGVKDVFIGGRYGEFYAINGISGSMIWEFFPYSPAFSVDSGWFNFYNPQFIPDQNFDGTPDILVANGGNHSAPPWDTIREPGMLLVLDALSGNVLAKDTMPDGEETYCAPVVVNYSGQLDIIYGSGGENDKGALWRASLTDLMSNNLENSHMLASDPSLGFIAPSSIADMNNDGILDIINQAYDGTIRCFDGSNNNLIWEVLNAGTESSSGPTIGNFIGDATPDVFNVIYKGVAPTFVEFYQILIDGATGNIAWKDSIADLHYGSSAAIDLDLNGRDEVIISVNNHNGTSFTHQLLSIDFQNNLTTPIYSSDPGINLAVTPMLEDIDNNGYVDFIFGYRADSLNPMGQNGFFVKCIEGTNTIPGTGIAWGNYQGTNKDGHYTYNGLNCGNVTANYNFQNITCNQATDGIASVTPTSGVEPFTYLWNTGDISNSIDSMDIGNYSVIITDSTGCYTEITFNTFDPYNITFGGINSPLCPGDSNGIATVNSSGCPCMFSTCLFNWDSGDIGKTGNSLTSGWQTVEITHMDGCIVVDSILIPDAIPIIDSSIIGNIICATNPYASSFIQIYLHDSLSTQLIWDTGDSTAYIDSLDVGIYHVELFDTIRGCFDSDTMYINAPDTLQINILANNLQCYNDSSGIINTSVIGGLPNYQYTWSTSDTTEILTNLNAGYYSILIVDSAGCTTQVDSIEITQPEFLNVDIVNFWSDSLGNCEGGAIAIGTGGMTPYNFVWNDPQSTMNDSITDLCSGTYEVMLTDSNGCISYDSILILNTLNIHELSNNNYIVYPNPTQNVITLSAFGEEFKNKNYIITNNNGRTIGEGIIRSSQQKIDFSSFKSGIYYIILENYRKFKLIKL